MDVSIPDNRESLLKELQRLGESYSKLEPIVDKWGDCEERIEILKEKGLGVEISTWWYMAILCAVIFIAAWIGVFPNAVASVLDKLPWWVLYCILMLAIYGKAFYKKQGRIKQINSLEATKQKCIDEYSKLWHSIENNFIPVDYACYDAVSYMYNAVKDHRANDFSSALNLYVEELRHRENQEEIQRLQELERASIRAANEAVRAADGASRAADRAARAAKSAKRKIKK